MGFPSPLSDPDAVKKQGYAAETAINKKVPFFVDRGFRVARRGRAEERSFKCTTLIFTQCPNFPAKNHVKPSSSSMPAWPKLAQA